MRNGHRARVAFAAKSMGNKPALMVFFTVRSPERRFFNVVSIPEELRTHIAMMIPYISPEMVEALMMNTNAIESESHSTAEDLHRPDKTETVEITPVTSGVGHADSLRAIVGLIVRWLL